MIAYHEFIAVAELIGIAVFAITGAIAVPGKRIDIFGVVVLGIVTALGGATLRDITLGLYPVAWVADTRYLWVEAPSSISSGSGLFRSQAIGSRSPRC